MGVSKLREPVHEPVTMWGVWPPHGGYVGAPQALFTDREEARKYVNSFVLGRPELTPNCVPICHRVEIQVLSALHEPGGPH